MLESLGQIRNDLIPDLSVCLYHVDYETKKTTCEIHVITLERSENHVFIHVNSSHMYSQLFYFLHLFMCIFYHCTLQVIFLHEICYLNKVLLNFCKYAFIINAHLDHIKQF